MRRIALFVLLAVSSQALAAPRRKGTGDAGPDAGATPSATWAPASDRNCHRNEGYATPSPDGRYVLTSFGCWTGPDGRRHGDAQDNCSASGLRSYCHAGESGAACEQRVNWWSAGGLRFGLGNKIRITDDRSHRSVIAVVADNGPGCSVERNVFALRTHYRGVIDASGAVACCLFGTTLGWHGNTRVRVERAAASAHLGPEHGCARATVAVCRGR